MERNWLKPDQFGPWFQASIGEGMDGGGIRVRNPVGTLTGSVADKEVPQEGTEKVLHHQLLEPDLLASPIAALTSSERVWEGEADAPQCTVNDSPALQSAMDSKSHCTSLVPISEQLILGDNMQVDTQQQSEQQSGRDNKHLGMIEQSELVVGHEPLRRPLQDCTNKVHLLPGEVKSELPLQTKGHWKRKARLQGKKEAVIKCTSDPNPERVWKRERRAMDQPVDVAPGSPAGKRGRVLQ